MAKACAIIWIFAKKVVGGIESGQLIDPRTKVQGRTHGKGALVLLDSDGFYLLHIFTLNNQYTLRDHAYQLAIDRDAFVSRAVFCKWFRTTFPFKGSMWKHNKVPIDKFTDNNILRRAEFMYHIELIPPWHLVFRDVKPLKRGKLFNCWGRADPLTGTVEDLGVNSDWRNMYVITGLCWIGCNRPPFLYIVHDGLNNAAVFCDFVIQNSVLAFYSLEISLSWTMCQSTISRS